MDYRSHVVSYYLQVNNCKAGINGFLGKRASITVAAGTAVGAEPDQKQYPRIYNLTKSYLESSPSVLKHPPGPTDRVHGISPVALLMVNKTILRQYHVFVSTFMRRGWWKTTVYIEFINDNICMSHDQTWYLHIHVVPGAVWSDYLKHWPLINVPVILSIYHFRVWYLHHCFPLNCP